MTNKNGRPSRSNFRAAALGLSLIAASLLVVACGSGSSSSGDLTKAASNSEKISSTIPKSGCGAVPTPMPADPDGVLASLPASTQAQYAGYPLTVHKSVWANFKPNHPPPYKVGLAFAQLVNETQSNIYKSIKADLGSDPDIKLTAVSTGSQFNIPQQIQQFSSLLDEKPDLLILQPLTDAFVPLVNKAGKEGIPTISFQGTTSSKYSINVAANHYGSTAQATSSIFRQMGGKGNSLFMHGLASTSVDQDAYGAYKAALKNCPGIKPVGELAGAFLEATAKSETLKYLTTHQTPVDGVVEVGGMAPGIISAFKQSGRPIPVVDSAGAPRGSLGYWINNDNYHAVGGGFPPISYGKSISSLSRSILAGRGLKVSEVTNFFPFITGDNLDQWAKTSWNLGTPGAAEGPPQQFMSEKFLDTLFSKPAAK